MGSLQSQNWMKFLKIFEGPLEKYVANFGEKGFFLLLLFTDGLHTSLLDPGVPGVLWVWMSISVDLTDVTLADEDTNPIPTDNANRAIQGNVVMVMQPGDQCKLCHLVAKYATDASGARFRY